MNLNRNTLRFLSFILLFAGVTGAVPARAASSISVTVSARVPGKWPGVDSIPHHQQEFLDTYGTDDSAKALIRFTFYKEKRHATKIVFISLLMGVGIFLILVGLSNPDNPLDFVDESDPGVGVLGGFVVAGALAMGITTFTGHSRFRRKLDFQLRDYQKTRYIDPRIARTRLFQLCLKGDPREQIRIYRKQILTHRWRRNADR